MQTSKTTTIQPLFPAVLSLPMKMLPNFIHDNVLAITLSRVFAKELKEGELDFLQGKIIHISIKDAGIKYRFTLQNRRLVAANRHDEADVNFEGTIYNYLLLASRQEDTDALFFSRRLQMQGDTELGLYVKNFLDGLDMDSHKVPAYLELLLRKSLPLYERLFSEKKPDKSKDK